MQSPSAVILEPKKIKSDTVSTVSPSISHEVMGPDAMILVSQSRENHELYPSFQIVRFWVLNECQGVVYKHGYNIKVKILKWTAFVPFSMSWTPT